MEFRLPEYDFKTKTENGVLQVFDEIRKKYVAFTPEEWVRQTIVTYLNRERNFPRSLISIEGSLNINGLKRRYDILASDRNGKPIFVVECKAPSVKISQSTFNQIAVYNINLMVNYLLVTNGIEFYCCKIDFENKAYKFLNEIPDYFSIIPSGSI
jgi:hypothetical protein